MYVVELEYGLWIAPWEGDPGRTLKMLYATKYQNESEARDDLNKARQYRPFLNAKIKPYHGCALCSCVLSDDEVKTNIDCESLKYMYCHQCMKGYDIDAWLQMQSLTSKSIPKYNIDLIKK